MNNVDSMGRAVPRATPLTDNIRRQIAEMRAMDKKPSKLRIDLMNCYSLFDEIAVLMPTYSVPSGPPKIFGLDIQITSDPDFEVVE